MDLAAYSDLERRYDGPIPQEALDLLRHPRTLADRLAYAEQELRFYTSRAPSYLGTEHQKHFDTMIARFTREVAELREQIAGAAA